jgi:3-phosphoshikimate 1-carboxyvinyltransferase
LHGIDYVSPVSSAQIKSCVLLAGLFASGATHVDEPHLSRDHTERMLPIFGVDLPSPRTVVGGSRLTAARFAVPADISSAVFMLAAAAMTPGSEVVVRQVGLNPTRTGFLRCLEAMGAGLSITNQSAESTEPVGDLHLAYKGPLRAIDVPESLIPDMIDELPMLMAMAVTASGVTRIRGAAELRVKESDRIAVMAHGLAALGVRNEVLEDGLRIEGGRFARGTVDSVGDHRVAMAFALASLRADGPIEILDTANVATSFPGFPALARSVGLSIEEGA